jgi:hypothetical protein
MTPPLQPKYYTITRDDLEEFYDSLVHVCGKEYADNMWTCIENRASRPAPSEQENPCIENGCTDIENCDEICQHSRIYSPLQMQQARKDEREKVLNKFEEIIRLHDVDELRYADLYNEFLVVYKLLRSKQGEP